MTTFSDGAPLVSMPATGVALVTLNRPNVLNALRHSDLLALLDFCVEFEGDSAIRAVVITGAGRAFCAGGDVRALRRLDASETEPYLRVYSELAEAMSDLRVPVIAALNGITFGGGLELACMADIRVAAVDATFCAADVSLGLIPTGGLTWRLPRLVGHGRASWLLLSNATVDASEAAGMGLCDVIAGEGKAVDKAVELACSIAACPPHGVAATKRALRLVQQSSSAQATGFEVEANQYLIWDSVTRQRLNEVLPDS